MTLATFLGLAEAWAASAGPGHDHAASIADLTFPLINFLLFIYILKRLALPALRRYLHARRAEILTGVQSAAAEKENAAARLREYRQRLARVDHDTEEILASLKAEGEREKAALIRDGQEHSAKIRVDATFLAQQEQKIARSRIRVEFARLAEQAAEKIIKDHFNEADQKRLVERFVSDVEAAR